LGTDWAKPLAAGPHAAIKANKIEGSRDMLTP